MKKKVVQWIKIALISLAVALSVHFLLRLFGVPLYRDFYQQILAGGSSLILIVCTLFVAGNQDKHEPMENIKIFFQLPPVVVLCIAMLIALLLWLVSGNEPIKQQDPPADPSSSASSSPDRENGDKTSQEKAPGPSSQIPFCSLSEWEEDPFFLKIDNYCGYHVEEQNIPEQILGLLNQCLSNIEIKGRYPSNQLNGKESPYAEHTAKANELHKGYRLLSDENILLDYQIQMLEDELAERKLADELYQVSDNRKLIGDVYIRLGDIYNKRLHNINQAHEYYTKAFDAFLCAYRTCVVEGADDDALQQMIDRLTNTSDKLTMLDGMDSREQTMAPIVLNALKLL